MGGGGYTRRARERLGGGGTLAEQERDWGGGGVHSQSKRETWGGGGYTRRARERLGGGGGERELNSTLHQNTQTAKELIESTDFPVWGALLNYAHIPFTPSRVDNFRTVV